MMGYDYRDLDQHKMGWAVLLFINRTSPSFSHFLLRISRKHWIAQRRISELPVCRKHSHEQRSDLLSMHSMGPSGQKDRHVRNLSEDIHRFGTRLQYVFVLMYFYYRYL